MSAIRPDMSAGPMARSFRPSNAFAADGTWSALAAFGGGAWAAARGDSVTSEAAATAARRRTCMGSSESRRSANGVLPTLRQAPSASIAAAIVSTAGALLANSDVELEDDACGPLPPQV